VLPLLLMLLLLLAMLELILLLVGLFEVPLPLLLPTFGAFTCGFIASPQSLINPVGVVQLNSWKLTDTQRRVDK